MKPIEEIPSIRILGTRVHMAEIPDAVAVMEHWIEVEPQRCHHVVNTGMHGIMEGYRDPTIQSILNSADLLAPDGILAVLTARFHGYKLKKHNTGPDLLRRFSEVAQQKGYRYFLYGDTRNTLELLRQRLAEEFPNVKVVGIHSPPFRQLTPEEDKDIVQAINRAKPDVLWVALGMPVQERWIAEHREKFDVPVAVGAGASFKFLGGTVRRAPAWFQNAGLEWAWRLLAEPKRVWRRVFLDAPQFIGLVALQLTGLRKYG